MRMIAAARRVGEGAQGGFPLKLMPGTFTLPCRTLAYPSAVGRGLAWLLASRAPFLARGKLGSREVQQSYLCGFSACGPPRPPRPPLDIITIMCPVVCVHTVSCTIPTNNCSTALSSFALKIQRADAQRHGRVCPSDARALYSYIRALHTAVSRHTYSMVLHDKHTASTLAAIDQPPATGYSLCLGSGCAISSQSSGLIWDRSKAEHTCGMMECVEAATAGLQGVIYCKPSLPLFGIAVGC